jgi:ATP-binding cassette, subfamily B, multidrug efflux pump
VVNLFQRGAASMRRINRILATEPHIREDATTTPLVGIRGEIEFRGVSFRYPGSEHDVLRDISFSVRAGELVAVVGATGSGKTTLVHLLSRIYDPTRGEILLDGVPARRIPLPQLRAAIAVVPQDAFLFSDTIRENLALGIREELDALEGAEEERIHAAARVSQLHETIDVLPGGYDTLLGERGINLSGGQRQRATLARAIATDPPVLVLDDALSAVDTHTEAEILKGLRQVLRGRTGVVVSHRVSAVMAADLILVLDDGEIVERGGHEELLARGGSYAQLLRRQILEEEVAE